MAEATPVLVLDTVRNAQLEVLPDTRRLIRTGYAKNLDLTDVPDAEALLKVMDIAEMPTMRSALSASYPNLVLERVRVYTVSEEGKRRARLELEYIEDPGEFTPTSFIIRRSTRVTQVTSPFIPGTKTPIVIGFSSGSNDTEGNPITQLLSDIVPMTFFRPARAVSVTALRYGHPTGDAEDHVGKVNDNPWPQGDVELRSSFTTASLAAAGAPSSATSQLPKGYWMLSAYESQYDQNRGMSLVTAEAISRIFEDWSEIATLRNQTTGRYPFGQMSVADRTAIMSSVTAAAYSHGVIYPTGEPSTYKGIARIGPAPTVNFHNLFGF